MNAAINGFDLQATPYSRRMNESTKSVINYLSVLNAGILVLLNSASKFLLLLMHCSEIQFLRLAI
jgi:hypothetical protein